MARIKMTPDQAAAIETLDGGLLISAGAGSGKTRVLAERVVNAVTPSDARDAKADIGQVLAITFTEKAAGELAERVRAGLMLADEAGQARRVDSAWISTIHGMCARILRAEAIQAGIDPAFRVLEGVEAARMREQAMETVVGRALSDGDEAIVALVSDYGLDRILDAGCSLASECRGRGVPVTGMAPEPAKSARELVVDTLREVEALHHDLGACGVAGEAVDLHLSACGGLVEQLRELRDGGLDEETLAEALWALLAGHKRPSQYKGIRELADAHKEIVARQMCVVSAAITRPRAEALIRFTDAWDAAYQELKKSAGAVDFDDLQVFTARLLEDDAVAARWRDRFRLSMVDEFQDTDVLQLRIVRALAGDDLCTVGDEQQSIYRFRGADVSVFRDHETAMRREGASTVTLKQNFRSHPAILSFVNRLFGSSAMFDDRLIRLEPGREEPVPPKVPEHTARVEVLLAQKEKVDAPARSALANAIAERIATLVHPGTAVGGAATPVRAGDVVVLLRSYTHAGAYADALRAHGVSAVVVGGNRFFSRPEVVAMRALCKTIANASDEAALVALLRSEIGALSDEELLGLRSAVDSGEADCLLDALRLRAEEGGRGSLARASHALDIATTRLGCMPLAELLLRAIEDFDYDVRMAGGGLEGGEAYANVMKFARMADAFESSEGTGPAAFSEYLDAKEAYGEHEAPASLTGSDGNSVRIMSVHASKGLEFPVVVVPELGTGGQSETGCARWRFSPTAQVAMSLPTGWESGSKSPLFTEINNDQKDEQTEEMKRLFYVACTRAREVLILAGAASKASKAVTMLNWLLPAFGLSIGENADVELGSGNAMRVSTVTIAEADVADEARGSLAVCDEGAAPQEQPVGTGAPLSRDGDERGETDAPGTADASGAMSLDPPKRLSYTAVAAYKDCGLRFKYERVLGMRTPDLSGDDKALRLGSAVHALLELFGEDQSIPEDRFGAICAFYELTSEDRTRVRDAVDRYRGSALAAEMASQQLVIREAPFALRLADGDDAFILAGNIDAYASAGDRALIVDYKTGTKDEDDQELLARYRLQAGCYAMAARANGNRQARVVFVRPEAPTRGQDVRSVEFVFGPEQVDEIEREVRDAYARMCSGAYEPRAAWDRVKCAGCGVSAAICPVKAES